MGTLDFTNLTSRLGVGVPPTSQAEIEELVAAGYTHVVDLALEIADILVLEDPRLSLLWNGVPNDDAFKPVEWFEKTLDYVLPILAKPKTKIYLHCFDGMNRSPISALAVMIAVGWEADIAVAMIREERPIVTLTNEKDAIQAIKRLGYT